MILIFSQLFGNADEDVPPDPEAVAEAGKDALATKSNEEVSLTVYLCKYV